MSDKPIFLLVPGAWQSPTVYGEVTQILQDEGYDHEYVILTSVGADPPVEDCEPDTESVQAALEDLLAEGRNIVIVMHSYGSVPVSEALKAFIDPATGAFKEGKNGAKIIMLAYLASFVIPEGQCLMDNINNEILPWWHVENGEVTALDAKNIFFNDLTDEEAEKHIAAISPHSYSVLCRPVTFAPWKYLPSAYLHTSLDNAFPLPRQENLIRTAREIAPKSFGIVETLPSSHCPFLSKPKEVADFLIKVANA